MIVCSLLIYLFQPGDSEATFRSSSHVATLLPCPASNHSKVDASKCLVQEHITKITQQANLST